VQIEKTNCCLPTTGVGLITASYHIGPNQGTSNHIGVSQFTASDHRCDQDTQKRPWKTEPHWT